MQPPRSEILALRTTPLGALDARVKLVLTLLYTFAVVAVPFERPAPLLPLTFPLALAVGAGDVPLPYLLRRLLLGLPFVLFVVLFPLFLQTEPVGLRVGPAEVRLTEGMLRSTVVLGKFVLAFGAAVVLTATTGFSGIVEALARLRAPALFVASVALVWRYLFVLVDEGLRMHRARAARAPRFSGFRLAWASSAAIVGGLFLRALVRSERVHAAMTSRGFTGAFPAPVSARLRAIDVLVLAVATLYLAGCLAMSLGRWP